MALFVISDLHLAKSVPEKNMTVFRGWENYEDRIKAGFSKVLTENDTVILGGDISWGLKLNETYKDFEFLESLPCQKILIKGNHDLWWSTVKKMEEFFEQNNFKSFKILSSLPLKRKLLWQLNKNTKYKNFKSGLTLFKTSIIT